MIFFALSLKGSYSSFAVVLHLFRQLLFVGMIEEKLDEIGNEDLSTWIIFTLCLRQSLESLIDSGCQMDHISQQVSPCGVNDGSPHAATSID